MRGGSSKSERPKICISVLGPGSLLGFLGAVNWIGGVGVRPETTRIARGAENHGARSSPAMVTDSVFLGDCFQVVGRLASGEEAVAQVHRSSAVFQPGEAVHICWSPADEILVS